MSANAKRLFGAVIFFVWMTLLVGAFYVVQKPLVLGTSAGLANTVWTLIIAALLGSNALGCGYFLINRIARDQSTSTERVLLGAGFGLGILGIAGFFFGALGIVSLPALLGFQLTVCFLLFFNRVWHWVFADLKKIWFGLVQVLDSVSGFVKIAFGVTFLCSFALALAPPIEAFDALSYHLLGPLKILADGGIQPYDVYGFWHPGLVEGGFFWGMGLGSDRIPQLLHGSWAVLGIWLLSYWAYSSFGERVAEKTVLIILALPSLFRLASWSYTDLALAFYVIAALYAIVKWLERKNRAQTFWLLFSGLMTGMAMGIKYTSFTLPVSIVLVILFYERKNGLALFKWMMLFGVTAFVVAVPWYLRNWIVMDNPVYPFVFGGRYWDDFRMAFYAHPGSGIGFDPIELILLPLNATLGHRDMTFFGGRIGPLFLIFSPFTLYAIFKYRYPTPLQKRVVVSVSLFFAVSILVWTLGVINTSALWETRYLYPAVIVFSLLTALGWQVSQALDTPKLRMSFIVNVIVILVVALTLTDAVLAAVTRNPLAFAFGIESRQDYLEKVQPAYAQGMKLLDQTPPESKIYFLFEPRSYYANRKSQEDLILDNLAHDLYINKTPEAVYQSWIDEGFTHVLLYRKGVDYLLENRSEGFTVQHQAALDYLLQNRLNLVATTSDDSYELYLIRQ